MSNVSSDQWEALRVAAKDFWSGLDKSRHEMGVVWQAKCFRLHHAHHDETGLFAFDGEALDGQRIRLIQHFTQLNIAFVAIPKADVNAPQPRFDDFGFSQAAKQIRESRKGP